jgi:cytochrome c oxidase subunit II
MATSEPHATAAHRREPVDALRHGPRGALIIADTDANAMIVPGFVSEITTRLYRIGAYEMPCHEYCGFGHHGMWARVVVVPRDHFPTLRPAERMTCVPR